MDIVTSNTKHVSRHRRIGPVLLMGAAFFVLMTQVTVAVEVAKRPFAIRSGDAIVTLKQFVAQSGRELIYSGVAVEGVRTGAVEGEFTAREALNQMLTGTPLRAVEDEKTGALAVVHSVPPGHQPAAVPAQGLELPKKKLT